MKKLSILLIAILSLSLLFGCQGNANNSSIENSSDADISGGGSSLADSADSGLSIESQISQTSDSGTQSNGAALGIKNYFAYKANTKYTFDGKGNEFAAYTVFVDYIDGTTAQTRTNNGGTEMVRVIAAGDGALTLKLSKGECYYRENFLKATASLNEVLLKEPLQKGTSWTVSNNRKRYISGVDISITTPSGTYKTIEVTTEGSSPGNDKNMDYYAPEVGLVKSVFGTGVDEITSTLAKIESDTPLKQTVTFYYPDGNSDKIYYVERTLSFNTNDITRAVFESNFKNVPSGVSGKVLGPNVKIKSLYLNADKMVYVDFSKELVPEMNAGSGYEAMILQCITNTLGKYYGIDKVYITIEGKPYSSGHIAKKVGEYFKVDTTGNVKL